MNFVKVQKNNKIQLKKMKITTLEGCNGDYPFRPGYND